MYSCALTCVCLCTDVYGSRVDDLARPGIYSIFCLLQGETETTLSRHVKNQNTNYVDVTPVVDRTFLVPLTPLIRSGFGHRFSYWSTLIRPVLQGGLGVKDRKEDTYVYTRGCGSDHDSDNSR